jgi:hypothetical protein
MKRFLVSIALSLTASSGFSADARIASHGQDMPLGKPIAIAAALSDTGHWSGRYGKFEGRVTEVCQNRGCWLVLAEGEHHARVFTGHQFFLPKDFRGNAVVYGLLGRRTVSEGFARHLAEDAGRDPGQISGEQVEYRIDARSIQLLPAP